MEGEGNKLGNLGRAQSSLVHCQEEIQYHTAALGVCREIGDKHGEGSNLYNLGKNYMEIEDFEKAEQLLLDSIRVFDAIWSGLRNDEHRISFDDGAMQQASQLLQCLYSETGKQGEALECSERARSRFLELLLAKQRIKGGKSCSDSPALSLSADALDISSMRDVALRQRATIIRFSQVSNKTVLVWVLPSDASRQFFSKTLQVSSKDDCLSQLSQLVEATRRSLRAPARYGGKACSPLRNNTTRASSAKEERQIQNATSKKLLRHCFDMLIEPLLPGLAGESHLIVVADKDLCGLPFAALLSREGKHMIERFSIRMAPSIGTLIELEKRVPSCELVDAQLSALVVGDPNFQGRLNQLDSARKEARFVKEIIGRTPCIPTFLEFNDACKDVIKSMIPQSDVVHLATHGTEDGIYLSGDTMEEGMLHMAEVQELKLDRTKMVVLSACDTCHGIARAFVAAGVPTLLATLWKVDDGSTHVMMKRFYRHLFTDIKRVVDVESALRNTMISMIRDGFSTHEWAPFVIYGLSVDFGPWTAPQEKSNLEIELEDLLVTRCRLLPENVTAAVVWCEENGFDRISDIIDLHKEAEFADALGLLPNKRTRLLKLLGKKTKAK